MPLDGTFVGAATDLDNALTLGVTGVLASSIAAVRPIVGTAMGIYVIGTALLIAHGKANTHDLTMAIVRGVVVGLLLTTENYGYYVRDLFMTDVPNRVAVAFNGLPATARSAQQFDVVWNAILDLVGICLQQATGILNAPERLMILAIASVTDIPLWIMFGIWEMSRAFTALTVIIGPWVLGLFLFRSTASFGQQWIGKLVGLAMSGIAASAMLRILVVIINSRGYAIRHAIPTDGTVSTDVLIGNMTSICGVTWFCALLMFAIPVAFSFGSGAAVGAAAMSSTVTGAIGGMFRGIAKK